MYSVLDFFEPSVVLITFRKLVWKFLIENVLIFIPEV